MSYFDDELEKNLSNSNITFEKLKPEVHDSFVSSINKKFPFSVSKIAWNSLPNSMNYVKKRRTKLLLKFQKK